MNVLVMLLLLPVDRWAFVVAQCWENTRFGQVEAELTHRLPQHVQIIRARLVPDVVRRQIARPDDEINVLHEPERRISWQNRHVGRRWRNLTADLGGWEMDGALPGGNWRCGPACSRWSCAECRTCGSRPSVRRRRWAMMGCRPSGGSTVAPSRPRNCLRGSKDRSACPTGAVPNQSTWSVNLKESSQRIIAKNHRKESQNIPKILGFAQRISKNLKEF